MTPRLFIVILLAVLLLVWLLDEATEEPVESTTVRTVEWPNIVPDPSPAYAHVAFLTALKPPPRARTAPKIRSASVGAPAVVETESSLNGYPCGAVHDLPPCWVMRRESGGNPNAYNRTGCSGYGCYGLWQFSGEWRCHFGLSCDIAAWTPEEQTHAARTLWNHGAGCRNWAACG